MNALLSLLSAAILSVNLTSTTPALFSGSTKNISAHVDHLSQKAPSLNKKVLKLALAAYHKASSKGAVKKPVLTVIDYSLPSSKQRMWIFDVN